MQLLNALAEYRLGHWDAAADWATKMRANPKAPERGTAAAAALLAMAEHQRKHPAEVLGISAPTAKRDWTYARAWLFRAISASNE